MLYDLQESTSTEESAQSSDAEVGGFVLFFDIFDP